ncbi:hypothetical protein K1719_011901 [Acacia pycnantha]|nr:hypothetical protein K1719_011901 [Acacia pycnantha]
MRKEMANNVEKRSGLQTSDVGGMTHIRAHGCSLSLTTFAPARRLPFVPIIVRLSQKCDRFSYGFEEHKELFSFSHKDNKEEMEIRLLPRLANYNLKIENILHECLKLLGKTPKASSDISFFILQDESLLPKELALRIQDGSFISHSKTINDHSHHPKENKPPTFGIQLRKKHKFSKTFDLNVNPNVATVSAVKKCKPYAEENQDFHIGCSIFGEAYEAVLKLPKGP